MLLSTKNPIKRLPGQCLGHALSLPLECLPQLLQNLRIHLHLLSAGGLAGNVIKAWDIGVATMTKGEKALLTCRADYAYGDSGAGDKIPPGATLEFEARRLLTILRPFAIAA